MYKKILLTGLLVALAACSKTGDTPAVETNAAQPAAEGAPAEAPSAKPAYAYNPFPGNLRLAVPFHLRSDRFYATKSGAMRRHLTIELLEGDVESAAASVKESAKAAGYRIAQVKDRGDGITRFALARKGEGRIMVSFKSDVGKKPSNPAAVAVMGLDWAAEAPAAAPGKGDADTATP